MLAEFAVTANKIDARKLTQTETIQPKLSSNLM